MKSLRRIGQCAILLAGLCGLAGPLAAQTAAPASDSLTRDQALALETALADLNFDPGEIDGTIDARTESAIRLYQEFAALPSDGVATPALLEEVVSVARTFAELRSALPVEAAPDTPAPTDPEAAEPALPEPDAPKADAPEAAVPEAAMPEAAVPESAVPESAVPEAAEPEAAEPEAAMPEVAEPEPAEPELTLPGPLPSKLTREVPPAAPPRSSPGATESIPTQDQALPLEPPGEQVGPDAPAPAVETPKAAVAETPAAAPAPALPTPSEPAPVPEPKRRPDEPARGFDIGGVLSRLAKTGKPADRPADESAQTGSPAAPPGEQVATMPAPRAPAGSRDGYAAFRDAYEAAQAGDFARAAERYAAAIESNKLTLEHLGDAHYNRANALYLLGRYAEAIESYDAAIGSKPAFANAYYNRGFAYQAKGERARAIEDYRRARDLGLQRLGVRAPDRPPPLR